MPEPCDATYYESKKDRTHSCRYVQNHDEPFHYATFENDAFMFDDNGKLIQGGTEG